MGRSSSSISNGSKVGSSKATHAYASKFIGKVMDHVVEKKLANIVKNPKTNEKWMGKLKLSIQKKVSQSSKILFTVDENESADQLKQKIKAVIDKIETQLKNIKIKTEKMLKNSNLTESGNISAIVTSTTRESVKFDETVQSICVDYKTIADKIVGVNEVIGARVDTIRSTVKTAEQDWNINKSKYNNNSSTSSKKLAEPVANNPAKSLKEHLKKV